MDFSFDYNLVRSQKLLLSPHLKQAMDILEMNSQQLSEYVEAQVEENPVLEIDFERDISAGKKEIFDDSAAYSITLKEYLLLQLEAAIDGNLENAVGEYLIDNIDENGYLRVTVEETADYFNIQPDFVERVLGILQSFDPPGVCARNLSECLSLQLRQNIDSDPDVIKTVENYLAELAAGDTQAVARALDISEDKASEIFKLVKTLEPRPGREFYTNDALKPPVPDVIVKKIDGRYIALINEDALPVPDITDYFNEMETGLEADGITPEERVYIQNHIDSAIWLIKCMEQRKDIILRVAEVIADRQQDFFINGFRSLGSISAEEISELLNIHKSLVCAAIRGKYLQCGWGIFELQFFCTV